MLVSESGRGLGVHLELSPDLLNEVGFEDELRDRPGIQVPMQFEMRIQSVGE